MDILQEILAALHTEDRVMLATIISTSGSTPASALSKMLVKEGGKAWIGTVGGGCMEGDVLEHAIRLYKANKAEILTFHLNEDNIPQGLICGGSLDVLIEPFARGSVPLVQGLKTAIDEGEDRILATFLNNEGDITIKHVLDPKDPSSVPWVNRTMGMHKLDFKEELRKAYHRQQTRRIRMQDGELILEPVVGSPQLIIFGGGHVSKYVCRAAAMAGFRVIIVDDRREYANAQRFPEAAQALAVEFTEAFGQLRITPSTYIVIVTRGHRFDEEILERAVMTPARYIGMIGSKRKVLTTYEHLIERGIPLDALKRVHAPMGLEIGAVTPEEIGISIAAQLINVRRGDSAPPRHKSDEMKELFYKLERK